MLLMIDNYDSFTYNLVQYLAELGEEVRVFRNDKISLEDIDSLKPQGLTISPGPGRPREAGISLAAIRHFAGKIPILGVCLGHQSIGEAFGGRIIQAKNIMHGKTSLIHHDNEGVYKDLPNPFEATRYHSLVIEKATLPACLKVSAESEDGEIMGVRHNEYHIEGIQFHPESILTRVGKDLLKNFLNSISDSDSRP
ncbi:MAG: aminodeoxychorismate/anthranilate synthase component II [Desulfobacteria bacterium]